MDRTPVGIKHWRKVDKFVSDETGKRQYQCSKRKREGCKDAKLFTPSKKQGRKAGTKSERETEVVKIREWNVTKDPRSRIITSGTHLADLVFVCAYPAYEPAGK